MTDLLSALHEGFGFPEFRPMQREAVEAALQGRDVLVVMPTGAGKSLCFQLPALLGEGATLVVSPLIALMRDQVCALERRPAFAARGVASLHSGLSLDESRDVLRGLREGSVKLLYVAPERFRSSAFVSAVQDAQVARFVVDEAHCISEWGHDFRPDYLSLRDGLEKIGRPPVIAVTATATRRVQESIARNLNLREPETLIGGFDRPNLHFSAVRCKGDKEKRAKLEKALPKLAARFASGQGSGLIYVATRRQCEDVADLAASVLQPLGVTVGAYHAGMDSDSRNSIQSAWQDGRAQVLVATNAFGMGVDKPDVRFVIHYTPPDSPENYYQEAGRAGRDGKRARCVVMHAISDRKTREWFINNDTLEVSDLSRLAAELIRRADVDGVSRLPRGWNAGWSWSEVKARLALGELLRRGVYDRLGEGPDDLTVKMLVRGLSPELLRAMKDDLTRAKQERERRLDEMFAWCRQKTCRREALLDYFGDTLSEKPSPCCDNCDNPPSQAEAAPVELTTGFAAMPAQVDDAHALLQAMDALRPRVGKAKLVKILRASGSKDVERFRERPPWGALKIASAAQVEAFLDGLIAHGLLHQADEEEYFVVSVTRAGREAWENRAPLPVEMPGARRVPVRATVAVSVAEESENGVTPRKIFAEESDEDAEDELFEALRDWRRGQASAQSLPPYCVLSDKTLRAIARARPDSSHQLLMLDGIGQSKLEKYGSDVLRVVREQG